MKINIPKVIVPVDFGEYAEALRGQFLYVWVNPPLDLLDAVPKILGSDSDKKNDDLLAFYATLWSQGEADTQWTIEELKELEQQDEVLITWMITQTWDARRAFVESKKKASMKLSES